MRPRYRLRMGPDAGDAVEDQVRDFPREMRDRSIRVYSLAEGMRDIGVGPIVSLWQAAAILVELTQEQLGGEGERVAQQQHRRGRVGLQQPVGRAQHAGAVGGALQGQVERRDRGAAGPARQPEADPRAPFDLARGPVMRATLLRLGPVDHVLLVTIHHIVADSFRRGSGAGSSSSSSIRRISSRGIRSPRSSAMRKPSRSVATAASRWPDASSAWASNW